LTPVLSERITDPASSHPHAARWAAFLLPRKEKQMQILAYLLGYPSLSFVIIRISRVIADGYGK
jgi:hypothetical protein